MAGAHGAACAREIRDRALAAGKSSWEVVQAVHAHCGVSLLRAHRLAAGRTLTEVAHRLRAQADEAGQPIPLVSHQRVSKWESGQETPSPRYLDGLCRLYATRPDRLGFGCDYGSGPDSPSAAPAAAAPAGEENTEETMRRREFLGALLAGTQADLSLTALTELETLRQSLDHSLLRSEVGPGLVDRWEYAADAHGFRYRTETIPAMLSEVSMDLVEIQHLLGMNQPLDQKRRLLRVNAQLAGLVALLFSDMGRRGEMRRWFQTAQLAADESGDRALRAWVLAKEAKADMENGGAAQPVLHEARHAAAVAGKAPSAGRLIALTMQARALGVQGDRSATYALCRQAEDLFGRLSTEETSSSVYAMSEQQLQLYLANALRMAGNVKASMAHYERSLALFPKEEPLDPVLTRIDQAIGLVRAGEIDTGCRQVVRALLSVPDVWHTPLMRTWAADALAAVPARHHTQRTARELADLLAGLRTAKPTARR